MTRTTIGRVTASGLSRRVATTSTTVNYSVGKGAPFSRALHRQRQPTTLPLAALTTTNHYDTVRRDHSTISQQPVPDKRNNSNAIDPAKEARKLISLTNTIIDDMQNNKGRQRVQAQSIDSLLKSWSTNSKQVEALIKRKAGPRSRSFQGETPSSNAESILLESAQVMDRLARCLFSFANPHQVLAAEVAITAWSRVRNYTQAATRAQELFDSLGFEYGNAISVRTPLVRARQRLYHALLLAWSRSSDGGASKNALALFERMGQESDQLQFQLVDTRAYNYTMAAVANDVGSSSVDSVLKLWDMMEEKGIAPNALTYDAVIKSYQMSGKDIDRAVDIFLQQLDRYQKTKAPHPHTMPLNLTAKRIFSMCQRNPKQTRHILERCLELENVCPECRGLVDLKAFLIVMQAYSRRGNAEEAENLLMLLLSRDHIKPDRKAFGIVMDGYARRRTPEALEKVKATLNALEWRLAAEGGKNLDIDCTVYNILMSAYQKTLKRGAVQPVRETISRMKFSAQRFGNPHIAPDFISYTILMQSIIREGKPGFTREVDEILNALESDPHFKDDKLYAYAVAMSAWGTSSEPDAIDRVRSIFERIKQPDVTCYNTLLNAYAKHDRAEDALAVLHRMQDNFDSGGNPLARPDNVTYTTVLHALHNSKQPSWVLGQDIFTHMIDQYKGGDDKCKPTELTIATLFQLLASSGPLSLHYAEALKIQKILADLKFRHGPYSVTAFIEACSETVSDDPEQLKEAFAAVGTALASLGKRATPLVYNAAFEACAKLVVEEYDRFQFIKDLYYLCASSGHVNPMLLNTLQRICPSDQYHQLTGR